MVKKKGNKKVVVIMHQHVDERGIKFGSSHPLDAAHKNSNTQNRHNRTVGAFK